MTPTITITEEARAFFDRNPDPALRDLVDRSAREYSKFMGGLPLDVHAYADEDSAYVQVSIAVVAPAAPSLRNRLVEFGKEWISRHSREDRRRIGFSIHYV